MFLVHYLWMPKWFSLQLMFPGPGRETRYHGSFAEGGPCWSAEKGFDTTHILQSPFSCDLTPHTSAVDNKRIISCVSKTGVSSWGSERPVGFLTSGSTGSRLWRSDYGRMVHGRAVGTPRASPTNLLNPSETKVGCSNYDFFVMMRRMLYDVGFFEKLKKITSDHKQTGWSTLQKSLFEPNVCGGWLSLVILSGDPRPMTAECESWQPQTCVTCRARPLKEPVSQAPSTYCRVLKYTVL